MNHLIGTWRAVVAVLVVCGLMLPVGPVLAWHWEPGPPIYLSIPPVVACVQQDTWCSISLIAYDQDFYGDPYMNMDDLTLVGWNGTLINLSGVYYGDYAINCSAPSSHEFAVTAVDAGALADDTVHPTVTAKGYVIGGPIASNKGEQINISVVPGHESDDPMAGGSSYTAGVNVSTWSGAQNCPCL